MVREAWDARVPTQLLPRGKKDTRKSDPAEKEEAEMDEVNVVANIVGVTGPLGASNEDLKGPGAGKKSKKNRKGFARWA